MRKFVTTLFLFGILAVGALTAQENVNEKKSIGKWSIALKGGLDYYRVEPYAIAPDNWWWKGKQKNYALQASWAVPMINVEYTANRWFGVGLELGWLNFNRGLSKPAPLKGDPTTIALPGVYYGNTLDAVLYGSINLTNLVAPHRKGGWRIINVYVNGGLGGALYFIKTPYTNDKYENHLSFLGMASLTTAFHVSKAWELFMEAQYRSYTKEDMGGLPASGHSVDALTFLVGIRWKIGGSSKKPGTAYGHIRNDLPTDKNAELMAELAEAKKMAEDANKKADDLGDRVKSLENNKPKPTNSELDNAIKDLQRQIDDLKKGLATTATASFQDIRFQTDSHKLTSDSKLILDEIFNVLNNDSWTTLEIFGYTDNVASAAYNQKLSERRANSVKEYLVKKGLDAAKIKTTGRGIRGNENSVDGRAENRRVEFKVSK